MAENLVIVGDGIAGPALARGLAEQRTSSTLIVRKDMCHGVSSSGYDHRTSAPLVSLDTVQELGISSPNDVYASETRIYAGNTDLTGFPRKLGLFTSKRNPTVALDSESASNKLLEYAYSSPLVNVVEGEVTGVFTTDNISERTRTGLVGLMVGEQEIETSLVFDATGRNAQGVTALVEDKLDDAIVKRSKYQPATYVGAYVHLEGIEDSKHFSDSSSTFYAGILRNGSHAFLAPHRLDGSSANHLFFMSSGAAAVTDAYTSARRAHQKILDSTYIATLDCLTMGTFWHEIIDHMTAADRTIYFKYTKAMSRIPRIGGLAMIGDAQVHVNPVAAAGFRYIATDVKKFCDLVASSDNFVEAGKRYNRAQAQSLRLRLFGSQVVSTILKYADKSLIRDL